MQSCNTLIVQLISLLVLGVTSEGRICPVELLHSLKCSTAISAFTPPAGANPSKAGVCCSSSVYQVIPQQRNLILNILCSGLHSKILGKYSFSQQKATELK